MPPVADAWQKQLRVKHHPATVGYDCRNGIQDRQFQGGGPSDTEELSELMLVQQIQQRGMHVQFGLLKHLSVNPFQDFPHLGAGLEPQQAHDILAVDRQVGDVKSRLLVQLLGDTLPKPFDGGRIDVGAVGVMVGLPVAGKRTLFDASMSMWASACASTDNGTCTAIWSPSKSALKAVQTSGCN